MLRLYAIVALALAALGGVWYVRHLQVSRDAYEARATAAEASLTIERDNTRKANEASAKYQSDLAHLESERSNVPVVRLCKRSPMPASPAPAGSDATSAGHISEAVAGNSGPDIGAELLEYGIACEANMLQLDRLQGWIKAR